MLNLYIDVTAFFNKSQGLRQHNLYYVEKF